MPKLRTGMAKIGTALLTHLLYYREFYVGVPVSIVGCFLAIYGVRSLTGRAVIDDPGVIVGWLYNCVKAILIVVLTGFSVSHLFCDINTADMKFPWWRILIDSAETMFLLLLFTWILSH